MCVSIAFQQRQETNKSIPRTSSTPLSASPSVLFTDFTHHLHLRKKSFKFLKIEGRATVGGAAAGSLSKPEHRVKHLRDVDVGILVNIMLNPETRGGEGYSRFLVYGCSPSP